MTKNIKIFIIFVIIFSFYSCSSLKKENVKSEKKSEVKKENVKDKIEKKIEIITVNLILDKKEILSNNKDIIKLKVTNQDNKEVTEGIKIYLNDKEYKEKEFKTNKLGEYIFYAKYKEIESEKITVIAKMEITKINLILDKKKILSNNKDIIRLKVTNQDNKEITEEIEIYLNDKEYKEKEFKTDKAGKYIFYVKYKEIESKKNIVVVKKEITKINLILDKKEIIADNKQKISYKVNDQDNDEVTEKIKMFVNDEEYKEKEFKTDKTGEYIFYVKYKEIESEKITVLVRKIDEILPKITQIYLEKKVKDDLLRRIVIVIFSEKIKTEDLENKIKLYSKDELVEYLIETEDRRIKITPKKMEYGSTYTIKIDNILDMYDNKLEKPEEFKFKTINLIKPKLMDIKKGEFIMGDEVGDLWEEHRPTHNVTLTYDFSIGKYEVTNEEYNFYLKEIGQKSEKDNQVPRTNITWFDAIKYCNWLSKSDNLPLAYDEKNGDLLDAQGKKTKFIEKVLGYRLPTEAEWEYVARSNDAYKYSGSNNVDEIAIYSENSISKAGKVGKKKKNGFNVYDMSGNVWEWCNDGFNEYDSKKLINPVGDIDSEYKIIRGGSWKSIKYELRNASRDSFYPSIKNTEIGFRIVKNK